MLRIKNSLLFLVLLIAASNFFVLDLYAQAPPDPESLARRHCIGLSDLDSDPETPSVLDPESPEFCGCTWGNIYYRGQIIDSVDLVSLSFNGLTEIGTTHAPTGTVEVEPPFYNVTGAKLGAVRNDIMTLNVEFDGQSITRTFRALPEDGEQQISFVLPEYGEWHSVLSGNYSNAIVVAANGNSANLLYAGGEDGLLATNLETNNITEFLLPWPSQTIGRIAAGSDGLLWASDSSNELGYFDGSSWTPMEIPYAGTIRALHVHTESGKLWVGISENSQGTIATYDDGTWETEKTFATVPVMTLTQDAAGAMWAGTWGEGVYRQSDDGTWVNYSVSEGLASRYVLSAVAASDSADSEAAVWFGTDPTGSSNTVTLGGVSKFSLDGQSLNNYGVESGIPTDATHTSSPVQIKSISVDTEGKTWILANDTLYWLHTSSARWITHTTDASAKKALLYENDIILASAEGVRAFDLTSTTIVGTKPTITRIEAQNGPDFASDTSLILLQATAVDEDDSSGAPLVVWKWESSIDGPICTTADSCSIPADRLSLGSHEVSLRVQDDEGMWSDAATTEIRIVAGSTLDEPSFSLFLPTIQQ